MTEYEPTIGLYGIGGVYNYGCEAIVRGTERILHDTWPDANIKYISPRFNDDKNRLKGCDIEILSKKKYPLASIEGISKIFAHTIGLPFYPLYDEDLDWIDSCDAIFSIGGDLYVLPPNYHDKSSIHFLKYLNKPHKIPLNYKNKILGKSYVPLIHFGDIVKNRQKKFIIWGASVGPFERSNYAKKLFVKHLRNVDLISSREPNSTSYLKSIGIENNVVACADPAFALSIPKESNLNNEKLRIGINLSPVSSILSFGNNSLERIKQEQAEIIKNLVKILDAEIILIPHVFSDFDINDDDLRYLRSIKSILDVEIEQVKIYDVDEGFMNTKRIISTCDIVIASRMHCAINAIEAGIPTILIAYSDKAEGMADYIYGNHKWVIKLSELTSNRLLNLVKSILAEKDTIQTFFKEKIRNVKDDSYKPMKRISQFF